jgi:hypothetical protein
MLISQPHVCGAPGGPKLQLSAPVSSLFQKRPCYVPATAGDFTFFTPERNRILLPLALGRAADSSGFGERVAQPTHWRALA